MRAGIDVPARWIAGAVRLRKDADSMLDIGGGHGHFSAAFCRRHPRLKSTILELPEAIPHAAPLLAKEGLGDRVIHRAGDARIAELGEEVRDPRREAAPQREQQPSRRDRGQNAEFQTDRFDGAPGLVHDVGGQ